jgi:uncharacterized RmlC-like cupin family protein
VSAQERGEAGLRIFRPGGVTVIDSINAAGVESEELVAGRSLFMKREVVEPLGEGTPHYHPTTTIVVMLRGRVRVDYGPQMEFTDYAEAGDCLFIPPFLPHRPANDSDRVPMECLVIRDAASEEVIPFVPMGEAA